MYLHLTTPPEPLVRCACGNTAGKKVSKITGKRVCKRCLRKPKYKKNGKLKTVTKSPTPKLERDARVLKPTFKGFEDTKAEQYCNELKHKATPSETRFKLLFGHLQIPYVFQYPIKREDCDSFYIVDFYMPTLKLVVEIDGEYHDEPEQKVKDKKRDTFLKSKGYRVVRLTNSQITNTPTVAGLKRRLKI
jgi:very-short-patch-repair endonuclease